MRSFLVTTAILFSTNLFAIVPATCPKAMKVYSDFPEVPEGWSVFPPYKDSSFLEHVSIFYGNPINLERRKPYPTEDSIDESRVFYRLGRDLNDSAGNNYWLACYYHGSKKFIAKELPRSLSECVVTTQKNRGYIDVLCK